MQHQLLTMLDLQHAMNQKVHANWQAQQFPWHRAIWIECAELLEHHGWKWWKKQQPDYNQVVLELVDIWHFGLSALLQQGETAESLVQTIEAQWHQPQAYTHLAEAVESFVQQVLATRGFPVTAFAGLLNCADLSFEQLYRLYIGKNMLNLFRQDNGYQQGVYQKEWQGKEDNIHLTEILAQLDVQAQDFKHQVYSALAARYALLDT